MEHIWFMHDLGDDQAHAALGAGTVMINQVVGHVAMIGQVGGHRRHKDAVLDLGLKCVLLERCLTEG